MGTSTETATISREIIEKTIESLPVQNRTMIRLLLLQYQDVEKEDIEYIAADQPDSRFQAGEQPSRKFQETFGEGTQEVTDRTEQYRHLFRETRERPWLQIE